jgi:hypothetical protein
LKLLVALERYSDAVDVASEISEAALAKTVAAAPPPKRSALWLQALHRRLTVGASLTEVLEASEHGRGALGIEELLPFLDDVDGSAADTAGLLRRICGEERAAWHSLAESLGSLGRRTQRKAAALKKIREARGVSTGGARKCAICGRNLSGLPGRSALYGALYACAGLEMSSVCAWEFVAAWVVLDQSFHKLLQLLFQIRIYQFCFPFQAIVRKHAVAYLDRVLS